MKHISVLIKPASSACNIRCSYCFYVDVSAHRKVKSFGKMTIETAKKMITNIFIDLEDGDELTLGFQGGEPTLAGLTYYKSIVGHVQQQTKKIVVHYSLQTNGLVINQSWCEFFKKNNFLVGLSIDGPAEFHNSYRLTPSGIGTFNRVMHTKRLFDQYKIEYNVLCVLTDDLAQYPEQLFSFIKQEKISYIQLIPCLDDLDTTNEKNEWAITPENFAFFYKKILELWLEELKKGVYFSIKLFEDLLNLFVGGRVTACGILGICQIQYIIEADGSVYPCDFYVTDEFRMGYIQESGLKELFEKEVSVDFLCKKPSLKEKCVTCPFRKACNGGCKRMNDTVYLNKEEDFCGYEEILYNFLPKIEEITRYLKG